MGKELIELSCELIEQLETLAHNKHYHLLFPTVRIVLTVLKQEENLLSSLSEEKQQALDKFFDETCYYIDNYLSLACVRDFLYECRATYLASIKNQKLCEHRAYYRYFFSRKGESTPDYPRALYENTSSYFKDNTLIQYNLVSKLQDRLRHKGEVYYNPQAIAMMHVQNAMYYWQSSLEHGNELPRRLTFYPYLPQLKEKAKKTLIDIPLKLHAVCDNLLFLSLNLQNNIADQKEGIKEVMHYLDWLGFYASDLSHFTPAYEYPAALSLETCWPSEHQTPLGAALFLMTIGYWLMRYENDKRFIQEDTVYQLLEWVKEINHQAINLSPMDCYLTGDHLSAVDNLRRQVWENCSSPCDFLPLQREFASSVLAHLKKGYQESSELLGQERVPCFFLMYGSFSQRIPATPSDIEGILGYQAEEGKLNRLESMLAMHYVLSAYRAFELFIVSHRETPHINEIVSGLRIDVSTKAGNQKDENETAFLNQPGTFKEKRNSLEPAFTVEKMDYSGIGSLSRLFDKKIGNVARKEGLSHMMGHPSLYGLVLSPYFLNQDENTLSLFRKMWFAKIKAIMDEIIDKEEVATVSFCNTALSETGQWRRGDLFPLCVFIQVMGKATEHYRLTSLAFDEKETVKESLEIKEIIHQDIDIKITFIKPLSYFISHLGILFDISSNNTLDILQAAQKKDILPANFITLITTLFGEIGYLRERQTYQIYQQANNKIAQDDKFLLTDFTRVLDPIKDKGCLDDKKSPLTKNEQAWLRHIFRGFIKPLEVGVNQILLNLLKEGKSSIAREWFKNKYYVLAEEVSALFLESCKLHPLAFTKLAPQEYHCQETLAILNTLASQGHEKVVEKEEQGIADCIALLFENNSNNASSITLQGALKKDETGRLVAGCLENVSLPQAILASIENIQQGLPSEGHSLLLSELPYENEKNKALSALLGEDNELFYYCFNDATKEAAFNLVAYQVLGRLLGLSLMPEGLLVTVRLKPSDKACWVWIEKRKKGARVKALSSPLSRENATALLKLQGLGLTQLLIEDFIVAGNQWYLASNDYAGLFSSKRQNPLFITLPMTQPLEIGLLSQLVYWNKPALLAKWQEITQRVITSGNPDLFECHVRAPFVPFVWQPIIQRGDAFITRIQHLFKLLPYRSDNSYSVQEALLTIWPGLLSLYGIKQNLDENTLSKDYVNQKTWESLVVLLAKKLTVPHETLLALNYQTLPSLWHGLYLEIIKEKASNKVGLTVEEFNLSYHQTVSDEDIVLLLSHCPEVKQLNLSSCPNITDKLINKLQQKEVGKNLEVLILDDNLQLINIIDEKGLEKLEALSLQRCTQLEYVSLKAQVKSFKLSLKGCSVIVKEAKEFAKVWYEVINQARVKEEFAKEQNALEQVQALKKSLPPVGNLLSTIEKAELEHTLRPKQSESPERLRITSSLPKLSSGEKKEKIDLVKKVLAQNHHALLEVLLPTTIALPLPSFFYPVEKEDVIADFLKKQRALIEKTALGISIENNTKQLEKLASEIDLLAKKATEKLYQLTTLYLEHEVFTKLYSEKFLATTSEWRFKRLKELMQSLLATYQVEFKTSITAYQESIAKKEVHYRYCQQHYRLMHYPIVGDTAGELLAKLWSEEKRRIKCYELVKHASHLLPSSLQQHSEKERLEMLQNSQLALDTCDKKGIPLVVYGLFYSNWPLYERIKIESKLQWQIASYIIKEKLWAWVPVLFANDAFLDEEEKACYQSEDYLQVEKYRQLLREEEIREGQIKAINERKTVLEQIKQNWSSVIETLSFSNIKILMPSATQAHLDKAYTTVRDKCIKKLEQKLASRKTLYWRESIIHRERHPSQWLEASQEAVSVLEKELQGYYKKVVLMFFGAKWDLEGILKEVKAQKKEEIKELKKAFSTKLKDIRAKRGQYTKDKRALAKKLLAEQPFALPWQIRNDFLPNNISNLQLDIITTLNLFLHQTNEKEENFAKLPVEGYQSGDTVLHAMIRDSAWEVVLFILTQKAWHYVRNKAGKTVFEIMDTTHQYTLFDYLFLKKDWVLLCRLLHLVEEALLHSKNNEGLSILEVQDKEEGNTLLHHLLFEIVKAWNTPPEAFFKVMEYLIQRGACLKIENKAGHSVYQLLTSVETDKPLIKAEKDINCFKEKCRQLLLVNRQVVVYQPRVATLYNKTVEERSQFKEKIAKALKSLKEANEKETTEIEKKRLAIQSRWLEFNKANKLAKLSKREANLKAKEAFKEALEAVIDASFMQFNNYDDRLKAFLEAYAKRPNSEVPTIIEKIGKEIRKVRVDKPFQDILKAAKACDFLIAKPEEGLVLRNPGQQDVEVNKDQKVLIPGEEVERERKLREEAEKKVEEERRQKEEERRQKEEERKQKEEERRQKEEAEKRVEEERKQKEEAEKRAEEERKQKEEAEKRVEEERKQKEEIQARQLASEEENKRLKALLALQGISQKQEPEEPLVMQRRFSGKK